MYLAIPFVADATATQHYNRYSYALNNPMKYTDPTGYIPYEFQVEAYFNWMDNRDINYMHDGVYYGDGFYNHVGHGKLYSMMWGKLSGSYSVFITKNTTMDLVKAGLIGYEGGELVPGDVMTSFQIRISDTRDRPSTETYNNANSYYPYSNGSYMGRMYAGIGTIYTKPTITNDNNFLLQNYAPALNYHKGKPISISDWTKRYMDKTLNQIRNENSSTENFNSKIGGPFSRWVRDPLIMDKTVYIDMKHFLAAITAQRWMGDLNEWYQAQRNNPSAYNPQDYYSNNLGYAFYSYYINEVNPYKNGPQISTSTDIALHIQKFLTNTSLRNLYLK